MHGLLEALKGADAEGYAFAQAEGILKNFRIYNTRTPQQCATWEAATPPAPHKRHRAQRI